MLVEMVDELEGKLDEPKEDEPVVVVDESMCEIEEFPVPRRGKNFESNTDSEKAADIAFVIENANCNSKKDFTGMSKVIKGLLKKSGKNNCVNMLILSFIRGFH